MGLRIWRAAGFAIGIAASTGVWAQESPTCRGKPAIQWIDMVSGAGTCGVGGTIRSAQNNGPCLILLHFKAGGVNQSMRVPPHQRPIAGCDAFKVDAYCLRYCEGKLAVP